MEEAAAQNEPEREVIVIEDDSEYNGSIVGDFEDDLLDGNFFDNYIARPPTDLDSPLASTPAQALDGSTSDLELPHIEPPPPAIQRPKEEAMINDPETLHQLFLNQALTIFPDVCHDHLNGLYETQVATLGHLRTAAANEQLTQTVITQIVDAGNYPKEKSRQKDMKRKRSSESESDRDEKAYMAPEREKVNEPEAQRARRLLLSEFPGVPFKFIDQKLREAGNLYPAYEAIKRAQQGLDQSPNRPYQKLVRPRKLRPTLEMIEAYPTGYAEDSLRRELAAARKKREKEESKLKKKKEEADVDAAFEKECIRTGNTTECKCCFDQVPTPKATQCMEGHQFCLDCALKNAKLKIDQGRHDVTCMDGSGCKAQFSRQERRRFLDDKLQSLLDRLQQQDELRAAKLEGLEWCPFCDFAAICPSVEVDKEFRCENLKCEVVSCRLCKAHSHIPLTCEEYKKDQGVDQRHAIEEAMTEALIRTCPKCQARLVKDGGCNKMVCSRCKCSVCDCCGKDITRETYGHFDVPQSISGRPKCPSSDADSGVARHNKSVEEAAKDAMAKVRAENPDLSEEDLKIKFSSSVATTTTHTHFAAIAAPLGAFRVGIHQLGPQPLRARRRRAPREPVPTALAPQGPYAPVHPPNPRPVPHMGTRELPNPLYHNAAAAATVHNPYLGTYPINNQLVIGPNNAFYWQQQPQQYMNGGAVQQFGNLVNPAPQVPRPAGYPFWAPLPLLQDVQGRRPPDEDEEM